MKADTSSLVSHAEDLATFTQEEGFHLEFGWHDVEDALRSLMSQKRYAAFRRAMSAYNREAGPVSDAYACMRGRAEIHTLFSAFRKNANTSLNWCISRMLPFLTAGGVSVADMGCLTGTSTRYLGNRFPEVQFTGIEREKIFLSDASVGAPANCSFINKDYALLCSEGPYDLLFSVCGFDHPPSGSGKWSQIWTNHPSENSYALNLRDGFLSSFMGWSRVAKPGAMAICIFRIPNAAILWSYVDAVTQAGWSIDISSIERVRTGDLLTGWKMTNLKDPALSALTPFLEAFERYAYSPEDHSRRAYLALEDRNVIFTDECHYPDGHVMQFEMGRHKAGGYLSWSASTQFHALQYVSEEQIAELEQDPTYVDNPPENGIVETVTTTT